MSDTARIAVIGDVHLSWNDEDRRWFTASDYDLVLFVGDLAGYLRDGRRVARSIAQVGKPVLLIAGNHDGVSLAHIAAEVFDRPRVRAALEGGQSRRCLALQRALRPAAMGAYSCHDYQLGQRSLTVIAARPHTLGGPRLAFAHYLRERFDVSSMEQSADKLRALVDESRHDDLIFLAHNGPTGLGERKTDIWGCDFRPEEGDFGDPDLRDAIEHAQRAGKRVRAVIAGHMHHRVKGGGRRRWLVRQGGTAYVNAAQVPRIDRRRGERHHVRVLVGVDDVAVDSVLVRE
jgi:uncharacterized protein (TIGR04168 family)